MLRRNHMRRYHHTANILVGINVARQHLFIGFPSAARHQDFVPFGKGSGDGQIFGGCGNVGHAVETRIVANNHIFHANLLQQTARSLVLHIERGVAAQYLSEKCAIPAEEMLCRAENRRDNIGVDCAAFQFEKKICPKFVFHENDFARLRKVDKMASISWCVEWQIDHQIHLIVILAHLVARWREERKQNFLLGLAAAQAFNHRSRLLKLAQRGGMKPHAAFHVVLLQCRKSRTTAAMARTHFSVEQGCHSHISLHQANAKIVENMHIFKRFFAELRKYKGTFFFTDSAFLPTKKAFQTILECSLFASCVWFIVSNQVL